MCKTTVVNKRRDTYDVYIGRGSIWGNPFVIGKDGDRNSVIRKYKPYIINKLKTGEITVSQILSLKGKRLACYCSPQKCHGDVLVAIINHILKNRGERSE